MEAKQLKNLCEKMTLEEKVGMLHGAELFATKGVERLGIPPFRSSDGPMGVRLEYEASQWNPVNDSSDESSYLPGNTALAATWNRTIAYETGKILGKEARGRGKDMILAPGVNVMRSPLCGRNFEYMGEDPKLASELVVPLIRGIEENDVAACVKHYALNNQEQNRMNVNVEVSERALRELYLPVFEAAVKKAGVKAVMASYNRFRGTYCCHHKYLLDEILRKEWKFEGIVVSDWGGVHDTKEAAETSIDMEMSVTDNFDSYYMAEPLLEAVKKGEIKEEHIDKKVMHILHVMNELHMLDGKRNPGGYNDWRDKETLLHAAEESVVLLKNEKKVLPLAASQCDKKQRILVIGDNANRKQSAGGGSAEIKALYEITPLLGISMAAGGNAQVTYERGYLADTNGNIWAVDDSEISGQADSLDQPGERRKKKVKDFDEALAERALEAAKAADTVIFVGGLNHDHDTEGQDMLDMELPYGQPELIRRLLEIKPDMVIVLIAGTPVDINSFAGKASTLVLCSYMGMEGGHALANVLFGKTDASGRLIQTFPKSLSDTPVVHFDGQEKDGTAKYLEDIFIGYRYYDTCHVPVLFPFGHGLSYTEFSMEEMETERNSGGDYQVKISLKNTGKRRGAQVVQLYVGAPASLTDRPLKELKAFEKVWLEPGESRVVSLSLPRSSFAVFDEEKKQFLVNPGEYHIMAGISAEKIILEKSVSEA